MYFRKRFVYLLTLLFIALSAFWLLQEENDTPLTFEVHSGGHSEKLKILENECGGEYFVFLPSYAELSQVQLHIGITRSVHFDDLILRNGDTCDDIELDRPYQLSGTIGDVLPGSTITFMRSKNIPAMYIDTASGNMDHILAQKGNEEYGDFRLYGDEGNLEYTGHLEYIKTRGNKFQPKMPYSIKLTSELNLLGMGNAQKWVLLSNASDPTNLRNKLVYDFAERLGLPYSPNSHWIDLYLNGEYVGLYLLCEPNEVHPQRLELEKSGSFLISVELESRLISQNLPYIRTKQGAPLRIRYSSMDEDALSQIWESVENAIYAKDGIDPQSGKHWTELVDLDSWTKKYLIEEVFGNVDGGFVSQFFFVDGKDATGKVYAGPVWDYDMSMANPEIFSEVMINTYEKLIPNIFYVNCDPLNWGSRWYYPLYRNSQFYSNMVMTYKEEFVPALEKLIDEEIEQNAHYIAEAARMNQSRWNTRSTEEETEKLRNYIDERMVFLNRIWLENQEFVTVLADFFGRHTSYIIAPGEHLPDLPTEIDHIWYDQKTNMPVDFSKPVYEDMFICLRDPLPEKEPEETPLLVPELIPEQRDPIPTQRLAPMALFAFILGVLCIADLLQWKRSGKYDWERVSKIQ